MTSTLRNRISFVVLPFVLAACGGGAQSTGREPVANADPLSGGGATVFDATSGAYGNALPKLSGALYDDFDYGHTVFSRNWVTAPATTTDMDGLGPLFNGRACSACHSKDGRSPPFDSSGGQLGLLFRLSIPGVSETGGPKPDPTYGDQLRPHGLLGVPGDGTPVVTYEEKAGSYADGTPYSLQVPSYSVADWSYGPPGDGLMISPRVAPAVFGLGLLEAIPEADILANVHDVDDEGVHGVPNYVWDAKAQATVLGRFGWKANQPSTRQQAAGAFNGDMGITSSLFPNATCTEQMTACNQAPSGGEPELDEKKLDAVAFYVAALAVPARRKIDDRAALQGEALFDQFGCSSCHVSTFTTGPTAIAPGLTNQVIHPYTDLLLHDMGSELADGRPDFQATGTEWRTPALWGIGLLKSVNKHELLLHDGRARGIAEAILWHGGEATTARENFRVAKSDERAALVQFVESL